TSQGHNVLWHFVDSHTEVGYIDSGPAGFDAGDHIVFEFDITNTTTGAVNFTLYDNLDHPFGDNIESTRTLDLNGMVTATDSTLPTHNPLALNGSVGVIDD